MVREAVSPTAGLRGGRATTSTPESFEMSVQADRNPEEDLSDAEEGGSGEHGLLL